MRVHPEYAALDGGLEVMVIRRLSVTRMPRIAYEVLHGGNLGSRPGMTSTHDASIVEVGAAQPFPVQLDGEYVGEHPGLDVRLIRDALWVLA